MLLARYAEAALGLGDLPTAAQRARAALEAGQHSVDMNAWYDDFMRHWQEADERRKRKY